MDDIEYSVIILSPEPEEAQQALNDLADMGWRVVSAFADDRVILQRVKSPEFIKGRKGALIVINERGGDKSIPA